MYKTLKHYALQIYGCLIFKRRVTVFGGFTVVKRANVRIGRNCAINHGVFILGNNEITIGSNVILSARSMLIDGSLDVDKYIRHAGRQYIESFIHIEDNAWIGAGAIILAGVTIGRNSIVGAGSVVTRDVPAYSVVAGNPARVIRQLVGCEMRKFDSTNSGRG